MAKSINKVVLLGYVGSDPETRAITGGGRVASFSLATSQTWKDASGNKQERTDWHRCVAWDQGRYQLAGIVDKYVTKGSRVHVEGEIIYRDWEDRDGSKRTSTEIRVRDLILLSGGEARESRGSQSSSPAKMHQPRKQEHDFSDFPGAIQEDDDDDLPF